MKIRIKRILALALSAVMLFNIVPKMTLFANETDEIVYYVAAEGNDDNNDGTSAEEAFATLGKGINALNDVTADRKVIKIVGTVSISDNLETHSDNIIITGNDDYAVLDITGPIYPKGPLTFESIKISNSKQFEFKCERSTIVFGAGVTMTQTNANSYPNILTGNYGAWESTANENPARESATIDSGNFYQIRLGSSATNKSISSSVVNGVDLTMNGGWAYSILLGADGWSPYTAGNKYTDDVNIVINGGTIANGILWSDTDGVDASTLNGNAVQLIFNNGTQAPANVLTKTDITNHGGTFYRLNCDAQAGSYLETTDTAGTYIVNGDLCAVATDTTDSTKVFYSKDGKLIVPEGTYDVTWTSELKTVCEVYVSASGSDDGTGTKDAPFATLEKAVQTIEESEYNGVINIVGDFPISISANNNTMTRHNKMITIQGADSSAALTIGSIFCLGGPLTIDNITVNIADSINIVCQRNPFSFGSNAKLVYTDSNINKAPHIITGVRAEWPIVSSPNRESGEIDGGQFYRVHLGNTATTTDYYTNSAGTEFVMNAGRIYELWLGADGWADDRLGGTNYSGDVNFTLNNGTLDKIILTDAGSANKHNGHAIQLIFNNGTGVVDTSTLPTKDAVTAKNGYLYIMNCEKQSGSYLSTTEEAGNYTVHGELKAIAKDTDGKEYKSENGVLTVEPGIYTVTWELDDSPLTVFVDETNGSDANDGLTTDTAFKTLNAAVDTIQNSNCVTGTITVIGTVTIDDSLQSKSLSSHNKMITIQGNDSSSVLYLAGKTLATNGPLTVENITITQSAAYIGFDSDTYEFKLGKNITNATYPYMELMAGPTNKNSGKLELSMDSGNLYRIVAGAFSNTDNNTDEINGLDYVHNGGQLSILYLGSNAWEQNGTNFYSTAFTDNVNIVLNGGQVGEISLLKPVEGSVSQSKRDMYFKKAVQILINNEGYMTNALPNIEADGGLWVMNGHGSGYDLEITETAGVYTVPSGVIAIAYSEDGSRTYVSSEGVLNVTEPGNYTVEYKSTLDYTNSGTFIKFYQDTTVNSLADFTVKEISGKVFAGWMDADGNAVTGTEFAGGTTLTAQYVDCSINDDGDFFIKGTQIREDSENQEIRIVVQLNDSICESFDTVEYGTVHIVNKLLGVHELVKDGTYSYDGATHDAIGTVGTVLESAEENILYTATIKDIQTQEFQTCYAMKGYLTYSDLNGVSRTVYTEELVTSVSDIAEKLLKVDAQDASLNEIITNGESSIQEVYSGENLVTAESVGATLGSNFNNGVIKSSDNNDAMTFYQLNNGLVVRDVKITGLGNSGETTTVVQISDPHFNYSNEEDEAEGNPSTMSTWANRDLNKMWSGIPNQSIYNFVNSLEYAEAYGDKTVITGDVLDYISNGTLSLMKRYINKPYSDALVTLGNHDPVRVMGLATDVPDAATVTSRYNLLQENWNNNVYYTSEMVSNDVMVIQLDNGQNKFWASQVEPLKKDLAEARENNYTVLLFMHIPMVTGNPNDIDIEALIATDDSSLNFYDGNIIKPSTGGDTETVYNLITSYGDVIKGIFTGHTHSDFYTEVQAKDSKGNNTYIPQYVLTANFYGSGHVLKITVE